MTQIEFVNYKLNYSIEKYRGKSLLDWARIWFKTSNDDFFETYKFNFNPHLFPGLYEIVRDENEKKLKKEIDTKIMNIDFLREMK